MQVLCELASKHLFPEWRMNGNGNWAACSRLHVTDKHSVHIESTLKEFLHILCRLEQTTGSPTNNSFLQAQIDTVQQTLMPVFPVPVFATLCSQNSA
jgi:hypothetical protein